MNKTTLILIIVVVVLVLGANMGLTFYLLQGNTAQASTVTGAEAATEPAETRDPIYVRLDTFTVTFDQPGSARFLQIDGYVVVYDDQDEVQVERHMPALRSGLVMLYASQAAEALGIAEGKEALREQSLSIAREVFESRVGRPLVEDFLFTNFVMQ